MVWLNAIPQGIQKHWYVSCTFNMGSPPVPFFWPFIKRLAWWYIIDVGVYPITAASNFFYGVTRWASIPASLPGCKRMLASLVLGLRGLRAAT